MSSNPLEELLEVFRLEAKKTATSAARKCGFRGTEKEDIVLDAVNWAQASTASRGMAFFLKSPDPEDHVKRYFCRAAQNQVFDIARKKFRRSPERLTGDPPSSIKEPIDLAIEGQTFETLCEAISELPEKQREVIELYFFERYSLAQIAERLGINTGSVVGRLKRALAHLRTSLRQHGDAGESG